MHFLSLIYFVVIAAILAWGLKSSRLGWMRAGLAMFILAWAVLIMTAQILSLFSAINVTWLYLATSVVVAGGCAAGLRALTFKEFASPFTPVQTRWIAAFLALTAAAALVGNLILAWGFLPANPDSI